MRPAALLAGKTWLCLTGVTRRVSGDVMLHGQVSAVALRRAIAVSAAIAAFGLAACASSGGAEEDASAGESGRAARGLEFAREACSSCHGVEPDEMQSPNSAAPTFQQLANRPDMSQIAVTALLRSPHRYMPALKVTPEQTDELAAYLLALGDTE